MLALCPLPNPSLAVSFGVPESSSQVIYLIRGNTDDGDQEIPSCGVLPSFIDIDTPSAHNGLSEYLLQRETQEPWYLHFSGPTVMALLPCASLRAPSSSSRSPAQHGRCGTGSGISAVKSWSQIHRVLVSSSAREIHYRDLGLLPPLDASCRNECGTPRRIQSGNRLHLRPLEYPWLDTGNTQRLQGT